MPSSIAPSNSLVVPASLSLPVVVTRDVGRARIGNVAGPKVPIEQFCTPCKVCVRWRHGRRTLGLRERKKLDTRRAFSDAALELAFERGSTP